MRIKHPLGSGTLSGTSFEHAQSARWDELLDNCIASGEVHSCLIVGQRPDTTALLGAMSLLVFLVDPALNIVARRVGSWARVGMTSAALTAQVRFRPFGHLRRGHDVWAGPDAA